MSRAEKGLDGVDNPYYTDEMRKADEELEEILSKPLTPEEQAEISSILSFGAYSLALGLTPHGYCSWRNTWPSSLRNLACRGEEK